MVLDRAVAKPRLRFSAQAASTRSPPDPPRPRLGAQGAGAQAVPQFAGEGLWSLGFGARAHALRSGGSKAVGTPVAVGEEPHGYPAHHK